MHLFNSWWRGGLLGATLIWAAKEVLWGKHCPSPVAPASALSLSSSHPWDVGSNLESRSWAGADAASSPHQSSSFSFFLLLPVTRYTSGAWIWMGSKGWSGVGQEEDKLIFTDSVEAPVESHAVTFHNVSPSLGTVYLNLMWSFWSQETQSLFKVCNNDLFRMQVWLHHSAALVAASRCSALGISYSGSRTLCDVSNLSSPIFSHCPHSLFLCSHRGSLNPLDSPCFLPAFAHSIPSFQNTFSSVFTRITHS